MTVRLLAVTPPAGTIDLALVEVWKQVGDVTVLLREPGARPRACVEGRLRPLREACAAAGLPMLVAADADAIAAAIDVVVAYELAGIHLRGDPDGDVLVRARDGIGGRLLGRSVHVLPPDGLHALVDYSCFAPVFRPRTGPDKPAAGLPALREWTADPSAWVLALGGVTRETAQQCVDAGARGLASISTFFAAPDVVAEDLQQLARAVRDVPTPRR